LIIIKRENNINKNFLFQSPTLFPAENFSAQEDARQLTVAIQMKDSTRDATTVIHILCQRSANQRQAIIEAYKEQTSRVRKA
jgi:hypothetical protein